MKKIISLFTVAAIFTNMLSASAMVKRLEENSYFMGPVMVPTVATASETSDFDCQEAPITAEVAAEDSITLEEAVSAFEAIDTSAYSSQSYYACFDEYEAAKKLLLSTDATDEQKTAAASALATAMDALSIADSMVRSDTIIGEDNHNGVVHSYCSSFSYNKVMSVATVPTAIHGNRACLFGTLYGGFDFGDNNGKVISNVAFTCIANGADIIKSYVGLRFEGSNDLENWDCIAQVTEPVVQNSSNFTTTYYPSATTKAYRYVRFNTSDSVGRKATNELYDGKLLGVFFFTPKATYENVFSAAIEKYSAYCDGLFGSQMTQAVENAQNLYNGGSADDASINAALKEMLEIKVKTDAVAAVNSISEYSVTSESWFALQAALDAYTSDSSQENYALLLAAVSSISFLEQTVFTSATVIGEKWNPAHPKANASCGDLSKVFGVGKTTLVTSLPASGNRLCLATYQTGGYDYGEGNSVAISGVSFAYQSNYQSLANEIRNLAFEGSNDGEQWVTMCSVPSDYVATVDGVVTAVSYESMDVSAVSAYRYVRFNSSNLPFSDSNSGKLFSLLFYGYKPDTTLLESIISEAEEFLGEISDTELSAELENAKTALAAKNQPQVNDAVVSLKAALEQAKTNDGIIPLSYNKNSIRTNDPDGIRFKSSVKNTVKADDKTTEYGFLVTLQSHVGSNSVEDDLKFDNEGKIKYVYGVSYGYDDKIGADVDRVFATDNELTYFTAVIYGVAHTPERLSENIIVRPYIKYNGEYIYGTPMIRSVLDVAKSFRDNNYQSLDEAGKEYIQKILVICSENV